MTTTTSIGANGGAWNYSSKPVAKADSKSGSEASQAGGKSNSSAADSFVPSGKAPVDPKQGPPDLEALLKSGADKAKETNPDGIDFNEIQRKMKADLIEQMRQAIEAVQKAGKGKESEPLAPVKMVSDILYAVAPEEKAADVPEEWNADNTSQRIVEFALSFRGQVEGMTDEEYVEKIRSAIQDGFRSAKGDLKEMPGPSAKLFNDTYEAAMKKLDDKLAEWKKAAEDGSGDAPDASTESVASATSAAKAPASTFSVVA